MAATRRLAELTSQLSARMTLPDGPVVVALSGGADSAALAALAVEQRPARAVHVHHRLRDSDQMARAAEAIATKLALDLEVEKTTVVPLSEGSARTARYRLLEASLRPNEWLLTGHTRDDQAETVLMNLLRGSGSAGLAGIPARRGNIARPLLAVTRSETREYATLQELAWIDDPTNAEPAHLRNRIRLWLLPTLEAEFNPQVRWALVNAAAAYSALEFPHPGGEHQDQAWRIANSILWEAGPAAGAAMLRQALRELHEGYGLDQSEVARVWRVVNGETTATELTGGLRVFRDGPWLVCKRPGREVDSSR